MWQLVVVDTIARWNAVVLRDEPGDWNTRKIVEQRQDGFTDGSADVFEVDIDAIWTGGGQARGKVRGTMIDRGVEAKLVLHERAFLRATGDANRSRAAELSELSNEGPDRTAGRSDDHGFSRLGFANHAHTAVRGEPRHAEHAETGRDRRGSRIELAKARAGHDGVRPPSGWREDDVALDVVGMVRG